MNEGTPNPRYDHVYAIVRFDHYLRDPQIPVKNLITVKVIVRTKEEADCEVKRLNDLNQDKGCEYFAQLTRLQKEPETLHGGSGAHQRIEEGTPEVVKP